MQKKIEPRIFWPALSVILSLSLFLAIDPAAGKIELPKLLAEITHTLGWCYLLFGFGCLTFLSWLAFGRYGNVKLGSQDDSVEFSNVSWLAMLFCAAIGIAIMNWMFVEPIYFISSPPFHLQPFSKVAATTAQAFDLFEWGIVPWAICTLPVIPVAYALYIRKINFLRFSASSQGLLGHFTNGALGKVIDIFVIFSIVGGIGTTFGLSVPLISDLISTLFNVTNSFLLELVVLTLMIAIVLICLYKGLTKGLSVVSNINIGLALLGLLLILLFGPITFLLSMWTNSLGILFDHFFRMELWTDPLAKKDGFPQLWTTFYWAWWIAFAPMMGLFVARISRGRTIKQVILGSVLGGTFCAWCFFAIAGGYAIYLQTHHIVPLGTILRNRGIPATVMATLRSFPHFDMTLVLFTLLSITFVITTINSAAYTLAATTTKELSGYEEPPVWNRLFWVFVLAVLGIGLLSVGGLKAAKISTVVAALPMIPVLIVLTCSLLKWLKQDFGDILKTQCLIKKVL